MNAMNAKRLHEEVPTAANRLPWDKERELAKMRSETRKEAKEAVAIAKRLGWNPKPPKGKAR